MVTSLKIIGAIFWVSGGTAILSALIPLNDTSTLFGLYSAGLKADLVIAVGFVCKIAGIMLISISYYKKKK
jgi:hypothetical protein